MISGIIKSELNQIGNDYWRATLNDNDIEVNVNDTNNIYVKVDGYGFDYGYNHDVDYNHDKIVCLFAPSNF